ncbi:hypothetical protein NHQ30_005733 [Ciborinia camelliae]|nr:hypothetical protein NHQ30_005733 [Ciborinia camelliae]
MLNITFASREISLQGSKFDEDFSNLILYVGYGMQSPCEDKFPRFKIGSWTRLAKLVMELMELKDHRNRFEETNNDHVRKYFQKLQAPWGPPTKPTWISNKILTRELKQGDFDLQYLESVIEEVKELKRQEWQTENEYWNDETEGLLEWLAVGMRHYGGEGIFRLREDGFFRPGEWEAISELMNALVTPEDPPNQSHPSGPFTIYTTKRRCSEDSIKNALIKAHPGRQDSYLPKRPEYIPEDILADIEYGCGLFTVEDLKKATELVHVGMTPSQIELLKNVERLEPARLTTLHNDSISFPGDGLRCKHKATPDAWWYPKLQKTCLSSDLWIQSDGITHRDDRTQLRNRISGIFWDYNLADYQDYLFTWNNPVI